MKIVIVGPGAIGCLFAGLLKAGGQDVWLLDKNRFRASYIEKNGIKVEGLTKLNVKVDAITEYKEIGKPEVVIFAVKSYDLKNAAISIKKSGVDKDTFFMSLQNGLSNIETLNQIFGKEKVLAAVTSQGSTLMDIGNCRHAGKGITYVGSFYEPQPPILKEIKDIFNKSGIETKISSKMNSLIWGKLIINVGINPITAICGIKNGQILEIKEAKELMTFLVKEATEVAKSLNIKLPYSNPVGQTTTVCQKTADNISSMLQDIQRGKKTEIDFINGAIVKQGKAKNISVPYNEAMTCLVKINEATTYGARSHAKRGEE